MRVLLAAALLTLAAGCSSSGSAHPAASEPSGIGQVVAPSSPSAPAAAAPLGTAITQGALKVTVAGPVVTSLEDKEVRATFNVTMTNTATSGDVVAPDFFGIRCDANRDDRLPGDQMAASTIEGDKHIAAGQTLTGTTVQAWLKWNATVKCTGLTTIEARFLQGGFLSWTLPDDVVAMVNKAGGAA